MSTEAAQTNGVDELFVAFILNDREHSFEVYLVNPTDRFFWKVRSLTGAFSGDDHSLLETSKAEGHRGPLPEQFAIPIEIDDTIGGLDFVIWYQLDLYETLKGKKRDLSERMQNKPHKVSFSLPKYGWGYKSEFLPILNREGMRISLTPRGADEETIDEKVKHLSMDSKYTEFD